MRGGGEPVNNAFEDVIKDMTAAAAEPEDYTGEDGLLYCGNCNKPKEAFFPDGKSLLGRDRHPVECDCRRAEREIREKEEKERKHSDEVVRLKRKGFTDPAMQKWTFANDNGRCPQLEKARFYVEHWEMMRAENIGYLLWGNVGTGKSYFAGCIANALMEQEVSVRMTNFATILNDLSASVDGRNGYIERLCAYPLLILDDFGMERGTEYGLEQVYNVVDSRYRSGRPLIVTTNLTLDSLQNPEDTAHARIYDRLLEMCVPVRFTGGNFRKITAQEKMERVKKMMEGGESCERSSNLGKE
jgi:DNA replication protein DnaC